MLQPRGGPEDGVWLRTLRLLGIGHEIAYVDDSLTANGPRPHVVIVGGGFGGLWACRFLARQPVDITLVDRRNHHLFQPLLYQVATGLLPAGQIAPPIRHVLRKRRNVKVQLAEVTGFDLDRKVVHASILNVEPFDIPYDSLIVAAGVSHSYFGHDDYARFARGIKTIDDALELRRRIFGAFEMAELATDPEERARWLTFAIVGAGPTGVELAGQIRELADRSLRREFRSFDSATARVVLIDGASGPLGSFGERLSAKTSSALQGHGVELLMDTLVTDIDASAVHLADATGGTRRMEAYTTVWAAGVEASPLAAALAAASGAGTDRSGRIEVLPDLTLPGHPEVFVVGDMAALDDLPAVAEVAMQGGLHAARSISRRMKQKPAKRFRYKDLGNAAIIGRFKAVVSFHDVGLSGFPGWVIWAFVHLTFLTGFGNRLTTVLHWTRSLVGRARPDRQFSTYHTGGDLTLPHSILAEVRPNPLPSYRESSRASSQAAPADLDADE
jgi:NADH dehydrogenase